MAGASIIGFGTVIQGNVQSDGAVEILGRVEGSVSAQGEVIVAEGASVAGGIAGSTLRIAGEVGGNLTATELVFVERTGRVVGDSTAPRVGIAEGALVRGHVRTEGEGASAQQPSARVASVQQPSARVASVQQPSARVASAQPANVKAPAPLPLEAAPKPPAPMLVARDTSPRRAPPAPIVPALSKGLRAIKRKSRGA